MPTFILAWKKQTYISLSEIIKHEYFYSPNMELWYEVLYKALRDLLVPSSLWEWKTSGTIILFLSKTLCVLNKGFLKHEPPFSYRKFVSSGFLLAVSLFFLYFLAPAESKKVPSGDHLEKINTKKLTNDWSLIQNIVCWSEGALGKQGAYKWGVILNKILLFSIWERRGWIFLIIK